jgi:DNA-directed RNA polymerase specialized sigma24 family protein
MLMRTRESIDFHAVEAHQAGIHSRLENWARWCNGREAPHTSPMFRLSLSTARARSGGGMFSAGSPVDKMDAVAIAKAVAALPTGHRSALNWCYIKPVSPKRACQAIGTSMEGLALLVRDGRQMLINRNI